MVLNLKQKSWNPFVELKGGFIYLFGPFSQTVILASFQRRAAPGIGLKQRHPTPEPVITGVKSIFQLAK